MTSFPELVTILTRKYESYMSPYNNLIFLSADLGRYFGYEELQRLHHKKINVKEIFSAVFFFSLSLFFFF